MPNLKRFAPGEMRRRIAEEFSSKIEEIARSPLFHAAELIVRKYNVSLSQACALLWRDWFTGDVEGLWTNSSRLAALYACNILELMALGKISCELQGEVDKRKIKLKVMFIFKKVYFKNFSFRPTSNWNKMGRIMFTL